MIKKTFTSLLLSVFIFSGTSAMVMPFWRGGEYYQPEDNTKTFIMYRKGVETLVLQPSWKSSTKDFGLVVPVPSKPIVSETSETIFDELESLTNNQRYWIYPMMKEVRGLSVDQGAGVTLVEKKDVGKITVSVLTATNKEGLSNWLKQNGYNTGEYNSENIDYYIKKGGYYFVAMKVNVETSAQMAGEQYYGGKLNPVSVTFKTSKPTVPTRSMYSEDKQINFTIFTLSDTPFYVNGSELQFVRPLSSQDLQTAPALKNYARSGDWLTRSLVSFEPKEIREDVILTEGSRAVKILDISQRRLINGNNIQKGSGVSDVSLAPPLFASKTVKSGFIKNIKVGAKGVDVSTLQYILKSKGYLGEDGITGVYDQDTKSALALYQEDRSELILKPSKLTEGTGLLGSLTRKTINNEFFK